MPGPTNGTMIRTFTGLELDVLHLSYEHIRIEDIAHSLAQLNRFCGHAKKPISVAQHSVHVARIVDKLLPTETGQTHNRRRNKICLQALLHDGAEAYLGEVTRWLKRSPAFEPYRELERRVQTEINVAFQCDIIENRLIGQADRIMIRFEGMKGFGPEFKVGHEDYPPLTQQEIDLVGPWGHWKWYEAEELFLTNYRMYAEL